MIFLHVSPRAHYLLLLSQDPNLFVPVAVNKIAPCALFTSALLPTYTTPTAFRDVAIVRTHTMTTSTQPQRQRLQQRHKILSAT